jgi:hypothetical protein
MASVKTRSFFSTFLLLALVMAVSACIESAPDADDANNAANNETTNNENNASTNNTNNETNTNNTDNNANNTNNTNNSNNARGCDECTADETCVEVNDAERCIDSASFCKSCDSNDDCPRTMACVDLGPQGGRCMLKPFAGCPRFVGTSQDMALQDNPSRTVEVCMNDIEITNCAGLRAAGQPCPPVGQCASGACVAGECSTFCNDLDDCLPQYSACEMVVGIDKMACVDVDF